MSRGVWRLIDPLLLRLRRRLAHLERHQPEPDAPIVGAVFHPSARLHADGHIVNLYDPKQVQVGAHAYVRGLLRVVAAPARIRVGHHVFIGEGSQIWAQEEVVIGNHVLIAHGVDVFDTDAHSLVASERRGDSIALFERDHPVDWSKVRSAPVCIEDDAWLGVKCVVTKGVTIGRGAVVAAGAVVTRNVPPFTLVAGNPAREVRHLPREG